MQNVLNIFTRSLKEKKEVNDLRSLFNAGLILIQNMKGNINLC